MRGEHHAQGELRDFLRCVSCRRREIIENSKPFRKKPLAANSCLAAFGTKACSYVEIIDHGSRVARRMVEMLRSYHWLAAVQTAIVALDEAALDDEERE